MHKHIVNTAITVLISLGITACSSGGKASQPGISVEENTQKIAVTKIEDYKTAAQTQLATAQQALTDAKLALAESQSAITSVVAVKAKEKITEALTTTKKALDDVTSSAISAASYVPKASVISTTAANDSEAIVDIQVQVERIYQEINEMVTQAENAVSVVKEKERIEKAMAEEAARLAVIENAVNVQLSIAQAQLNIAESALVTAQNATSSAAAQIAAVEAQTAANKALVAANEATKQANVAGESAIAIIRFAEQARVAADKAQAAAVSAKDIVAKLLVQEEKVAEEEALKISQARNAAMVARKAAETQLVTAKTISEKLTKAATAVSSATSAKALQVTVGMIESELASLKAVESLAQEAVEKAKTAASVSTLVTEDVVATQAIADSIAGLVSQAESQLITSKNTLNIRITREKEITTSAAYVREDSIVQDYLDKAKREELLSTVQKSGSNAPATCANSKSSTCHKDVERGTTVVNYNQAYSSYAVLREVYDSEGETPANAFIVLAKESDLTSDREAVTNATYTGKASYSRSNGPAVVTRDFTLNVVGDTVSGSVYQTTVNAKGVSKTTEYVGLKDGSISVNNGVVGFNGVADFNQFKNGLEGTYKGVFVGSKAEEVIGTFETNSTEKASSIQGAFAGQK